jgi:phenylpropionate dioxygenase-like ring-hydroxylating dioxygenase large terminal subunit
VGRRIRAYAVRERWGFVWIWAGAAPRYELPEPEPANARLVLRLPPSRLRCHPHVMLGNGLDFTHVVPVHRVQLQEDPAVDLDPPFKLAVSVHGSFWADAAAEAAASDGGVGPVAVLDGGAKSGVVVRRVSIRFELLWSVPTPSREAPNRSGWHHPPQRGIAGSRGMRPCTCGSCQSCGRRASKSTPKRRP